MMGAPLYPAQQYVFDVALEVLPDGSFPYHEVIDLEPRRSGKTHKGRALVGWRCGRSRSVAYMTAQNGKSAVKRWREIADEIDAAFGGRVRKKISQAYEEVRWLSGSVFAPFTPNEEGMHGEDPDLVVLDEWWTVDLITKALLELSYEPAFSIKADAQAWKLSAAGTPRSTALREDRSRGRAVVESGGRSGVAFFEWSIPERVAGRPVAELPDDDLVELVLANHPRAGRGLRPEFLRSQLEPGKSRAAFIRSYGNIDQADDPGALAIGAEAWEASMVAGEIPADVRVGVGVEVDPDGRESTVATGWRDPDGRGWVQITQHGPGVRWVPGYVAAMAGVGSVAGYYLGRTRGAMDEIAQAVGDDGPELIKLYQPGMAAASSRLWDGLVASPPDVVHDGNRHMEAALRVAELVAKRPWSPRGTEPITAVQAASAALWAADHLPDEPAPRPRFRIE